MKYYLAIDIGASSGRHILGRVDGGIIRIEEVHRFKNGYHNKDGFLCWDADYLFAEIKTGMKKCRELDKIPISMGIDTWGVDFVLLDKDGNMLGKPVAYRDKRTEKMVLPVSDIINLRDLYGRTGIQKQSFNTIFQLMAVKQSNPEHIENARSFLMIPDYFHYLLNGTESNEYTNASTTGLLDVHTRDWDYELIEKLGFNAKMFKKPSKPGERLGKLLPVIADEVGFSCEIILPPTHDTASAVLAVPNNDNDGIYLSSGTWSLMGVLLDEPNCGFDGMKANFTNEGGYDYKIRYLKNIMGLWLIQNVKKELDDNLSYEDLCGMAAKANDFQSIIDVNDPRFLAPDSMMKSIRDFCIRSNQDEPDDLAKLCACIYKSLTAEYRKTVHEIEALTGKEYKKIYVIGGGSSDNYLNKLIAKATGKEVYTGPREATALGNLMAQMTANNEFNSISEAKKGIQYVKVQ